MWIDDDILKQCRKASYLHVWIPEQSTVVLGSSNDAQTECHVTTCSAENIEILKRYGGGGAVVLYPGCLILSIGLWVSHHFKNDVYFRSLNKSIALTLAEKWPIFADATQRGLSDLCLGEKKFVGSSLFRSRNYLLFQASLICDLNLDLIDRYLKHPSKEPDYRQNRPHKDFLIGLSEVTKEATPKAISDLFTQRFEEVVKKELKDELIAPQEEQIQTILSRAAPPSCPA